MGNLGRQHLAERAAPKAGRSAEAALALRRGNEAKTCLLCHARGNQQRPGEILSPVRVFVLQTLAEADTCPNSHEITDIRACGRGASVLNSRVCPAPTLTYEKVIFVFIAGANIHVAFSFTE